MQRGTAENLSRQLAPRVVLSSKSKSEERYIGSDEHYSHLLLSVKFASAGWTLTTFSKSTYLPQSNSSVFTSTGDLICAAVNADRAAIGFNSKNDTKCYVELYIGQECAGTVVGIIGPGNQGGCAIPDCSWSSFKVCEAELPLPTFSAKRFKLEIGPV